MIKIMITIRNRLAITKKCFTALKKHSKLEHEIYVYDNLTNYRIQEHFDYFKTLYKERQIAQVTFNTEVSTFNAFSKAVASNQFGMTHEMDPNKDKYDFLLMLDNDIIVTPGFDEILSHAWRAVKKRNLNNIKVIGQLPGGIKKKQTIEKGLGKIIAKQGEFGGSGLWSIRSNFFTDVGFLDIKKLVNQDKKHDQLYWQLLSKSTNGKPYIAGLGVKLGLHVGKISGSICNRLSRNKKLPKNKRLELIKFEDAEKKIDALSFDEFYNTIKNDKALINNW